MTKRRQDGGSKEADTVRVLVSTDNHLGYHEKDSVRGDDSFRTFEEVLALARSNRVDMVLLGGDLFHDNKPSRKTMVRTMDMLRRHCLGEDPVALGVRSDPEQVNYMNPSYAISLPVFVIHGNHDDPTGAAGGELLSAIDILAQANLVTYFGKSADSRKVNVFPILLQKGQTKVALYGLGNIRDDMLYETWANAKQVHWMCPREDEAGERPRLGNGTSNPDGADDTSDKDWFSLFVIHQNRAMRGTTKAIADAMLPQWLDYVVWGHEHDSVPELAPTTPPISQPGSTVATSLSEGESLPKHAVLLEIRKDRFRHRPIPLQTVRNFRFCDVALSEASPAINPSDEPAVEAHLRRTADALIDAEEAAFDVRRARFESGEGPEPVSGIVYPSDEFYLAHMPRELRQPLIRLRVDYSGGYEPLNTPRFCQMFVGRVACAREVVLFYKKRPKGTTTRSFLRGTVGGLRSSAAGELPPETGSTGVDGEIVEEELTVDAMRIPELIEYFLYHKKAGGTGLQFLELDKLTSAVHDFVAKAEPRAIPEYVMQYLKQQQDSALETQEQRGKVISTAELNEHFREAAERAAKQALLDATKSARRSKPAGQRVSSAQQSADKEGDRGSAESPSQDLNVDSEARFRRIDTALQSNPRTAQVAMKSFSDALIATDGKVRAAGNQDIARSDSEDEGDGIEGQAQSKVRSKATISKPRQTGRVRTQRSAVATDLRATGRDSLASAKRRGAVQKPVTSSRRPSSRKAAAAAMSSFVADDDDEIEDDDERDAEFAAGGSHHVLDDSDEEPVRLPKKRPAASASGRSGDRASRRGRTVAGASAGVGSRPRGRVRQTAPTMDLDEDSS